MLELERPRLWIVAGPNGSGKSTLYGRTDIESFGRSVWIINPDQLTSHIAKQEGLSLDAANVETLNRIWAWVQASVNTYRTIGVETVLSTEKYRPLVQLAKQRGFEIRLLYVTLKAVEMNIARVADRVREGGHNVPEDKIRTRRQRSFAQLSWFLREADVALIYDNSSKVPKLIGRKEDNTIYLDPDAPIEIKDAVSRIQTLPA